MGGGGYRHTGIPTTERKEDKVYTHHLKFYVSGFPTSPFGIEWMRFEEDCPILRSYKKCLIVHLRCKI